MKSTYVCFSLLLLLVFPLVSRGDPRLGLDLRPEEEYFKKQKQKEKEERARLYKEFKDLDMATFQHRIHSGELTREQRHILLDALREQEKNVRDGRDKIVFLAGKVEEEFGPTLLRAYQKNDRSMIKKLRALGYNIDDALGTAVYEISRVPSNLDLIPVLLKDGARPNRAIVGLALMHYTPEESLRLDPMADKKTWAKERQPINKKLLIILPQLLKKMKDINEPDQFGRTLLFFVEDKEIMDIFLSAGADINAQDKDGNTILIQFVRGSDWTTFREEFQEKEKKITIEYIKYLLQKGANQNIKNKKGDTALSIAKESGLTEVVALLEDNKTLVSHPTPSQPNVRKP